MHWLGFKEPRFRVSFGLASDQGFSLLLSLALLAVLSGTLLLFQSIGFSSVSGAAVEARRTYARLVLDGALRHQLERILVSGLPDRLRLGEDLEVRLSEGTISLSAAFESGKVDVNSASPDLISAAMEAAGDDPSTIRETLVAVDRVRSRRSAVLDPSQILPMHLRVRHASRDTLSRYLTTATGARGVNPVVSASGLIRRMSILPDAMRSRIEDLRSNRRPSEMVPIPGGPWQTWLDSPREVISMTAAFRGENGGTLRRKVTFRIERDRGAIVIIGWTTI